MNLRKHTRSSLTIHTLGATLIGMSLGLRLYEYVETYWAIASWGFTMRGLLFIGVSLYFDRKS